LSVSEQELLLPFSVTDPMHIMSWSPMDRISRETFDTVVDLGGEKEVWKKISTTNRLPLSILDQERTDVNVKQR
jgi:hypothetical protein